MEGDPVSCGPEALRRTPLHQQRRIADISFFLSVMLFSECSLGSMANANVFYSKFSRAHMTIPSNQHGNVRWLSWSFIVN